MERRRALVLAGAMTIAVGAATIALAATGSVDLLGFGGPHRASAVSTPSDTTSHAKTKVVTRKRNVYDKFVVSLPTVPTTAGARIGRYGGVAPVGRGAVLLHPDHRAPRSGADDTGDGRAVATGAAPTDRAQRPARDGPDGPARPGDGNNRTGADDYYNGVPPRGLRQHDTDDG